MELQKFIAEVIAPRATETVISQNSGGKIELGEGNPYFENQNAAKSKMIEVFKEVAEEVEADYLNKLKKAFYEHKTLVFLYRGFGQEARKESKEKIQSAQDKVQLSFKNHELAQQANNYVRNNVR